MERFAPCCVAPVTICPAIERPFGRTCIIGSVSPNQEQQVCEALVNLGPIDTELGLHAEGVRTIQRVLHCSLDDARAALSDLRVRKRIEESAAEPTRPNEPFSFSWIRPAQ